MDPQPTPKTFLITGATGNQGGAVIDALLKLPEPFVGTILAVTRDASSPAAQRLAALSDKIKLVEGNLDDVPELFRAAERANGGKPIYGVYSVQVSRGPGVTPENEVKQGKDLVDEAIARGVRHFVVCPPPCLPSPPPLPPQLTPRSTAASSAAATRRPGPTPRPSSTSSPSTRLSGTCASKLAPTAAHTR